MVSAMCLFPAYICFIMGCGALFANIFKDKKDREDWGETLFYTFCVVTLPYYMVRDFVKTGKLNWD
jgi:hypothetical protein